MCYTEEGCFPIERDCEPNKDVLASLKLKIIGTPNLEKYNESFSVSYFNFELSYGNQIVQLECDWYQVAYGIVEVDGERILKLELSDISVSILKGLDIVGRNWVNKIPAIIFGADKCHTDIFIVLYDDYDNKCQLELLEFSLESEAIPYDISCDSNVILIDAVD